jgi:hypothetical protein
VPSATPDEAARRIRAPAAKAEALSARRLLGNAAAGADLHAGGSSTLVIGRLVLNIGPVVCEHAEQLEALVLAGLLDASNGCANRPPS